MSAGTPTLYEWALGIPVFARIALANLQPDVSPPVEVPGPRWGSGEAPAYLP